MKQFILPVVVTASFLAGISAVAQNSAAMRTADNLRLRELAAPAPAGDVPEFYPSETSDVGPQSLLVLKPRRHWVRAHADEQLFYSDNVFLSENGEGRRGADVLVSTVLAAFAPDAFDFMGGKLAPQIGYQHQWFNYGLLGDQHMFVVDYDRSVVPRVESISVFDFNVATVFADTTFAWRGWDFTVGLDYRRFLDSGSYDEFYRELVPRWAAHYTFQIAEDKSIMLGYEGDYRFTTTLHPLPGNKDDYNDRTDHSLVIVGNWWLCSHAVVQPFYRLQYSYFSHIQSGRQDWLNTFGLGLALPITSNVALRTFVSYELLDTDYSYVQSYHKFDVGAGLNLSVRF
jgi:hypothetical protein